MDLSSFAAYGRQEPTCAWIMAIGSVCGISGKDVV